MLTEGSILVRAIVSQTRLEPLRNIAQRPSIAVFVPHQCFVRALLDRQLGPIVLR